MYEYPQYKNLKLDRPAGGVLRITLSRGKVNAMDGQMHADIARIWPHVDADDETRAVVLTGEGRAFSAGGDFDNESVVMDDYGHRLKVWREARDLVLNMINMSKPVVSALNGAASGAGLAAAILADIVIAGRSAKLVDGHTRLGVAAGDHSVISWPLLCGMAKARLYLLTCDPISAEEAERIGLVSMCVDDDKLQERALEMASRLANGAQSAIRWTKHSMNNWYRMAWPMLEASLALEFIGFGGPDVKEGLASFVERRPPNFNPASPF
jgi:enoyl-CoA hydratase